MNNNDKMLKLVLSDTEFANKFNINVNTIESVEDALKDENPVVVVLGKILQNINESKGKANYKEVYNEVYNYLNKNLI
ncbi:MAG: hypothetical protein Q8R57_14740 [Bacteroidota bacterium]|nr:hypothetical protein [Bacteroidota bacterium]